MLFSVKKVFSIWEHSYLRNVIWEFFGCKWQGLNLAVGTHIFYLNHTLCGAGEGFVLRCPRGQLEAGRHHFSLSQRLSVGQLHPLQPTAPADSSGQAFYFPAPGGKISGRDAHWAAGVSTGAAQFSRSNACKETVQVIYNESALRRTGRAGSRTGKNKNPHGSVISGDSSFSLILLEALGTRMVLGVCPDTRQVCSTFRLPPSWSLAKCHPEKHQFQRLLPPCTCLQVIWESQASPPAADKP